MTSLSVCLPYYRNPLMLAEQYRIWAGYPEDLKDQIEIVLVDDGSPEPAIDVPRPDGLPSLRIFRVLEDREWHQHAARNLAAKMAASPWLLMTDIDHVLDGQNAARLLAHLHHDVVYTFRRVLARDGSEKRTSGGRPHAHINSFAITKARYWQIGGYDEDLIGYGTDAYFRRRVDSAIRPVYLSDVSLIRYDREQIPDAITAIDGMTPKAYRKDRMRYAENDAILAAKAKTKQGPTVINFPWERAL